VITWKIKDMFFDRQAVITAVDAAKRKVLSKAGAFIRTTAKTSIRQRKKSAPPGQPPHSHEGSLRRFIYFGYDRAADSVVVGPVGFKDSVAPNVLEYGGSSVVVARRRGRKDRKVQIAARPFMWPAFEKERPRLPLLWRNSVRRGGS
jgi:hypothetical protein